HRLAFDRLLCLLHYVAGVDPKELADLHVEWARRFERPLLPTNGISRRAVSDDGTPRRLRIGYVSRDFRAHPVSFFLEPVLTNHDRNRFEVFCYADDI